MAHTVICYEWDKIKGLKKEQRVELERWTAKYNKNTPGDEDAGAIIRFGAEYVTFTKYVGMIAFKDGLVLEVLPKLFRKDRGREIDVREVINNQDEARNQKDNAETPDTANFDDAKYAKKLLLTMLLKCRQLSCKYFQKAKLDTARMPLLEIFIRMFIVEVNELIRRGIRCGYETVECNAPYFKGKLLVSQHIRYNAAHQERCYVQYDEFSVDRLENRLIKATCEFLVRMSSDGLNRTELRKILDLFDEVDASVEFRSDISQYTRDRNLTEYDNLMIWCRLFMEHRGFSNYSGDSIAFALMYPMEKVYEEYIACSLGEVFPDWTITTQEQKYNLLTTRVDDKNITIFQLKPDIVLRNRNGECWILDTKWKILDDSHNNNYGISQSDIYQMYAYYHHYQLENQKIQGVILLYPCNEKRNEHRFVEEKDGAKIYACYVNLGNCGCSGVDIHKMVKKELEKLRSFLI